MNRTRFLLFIITALLISNLLLVWNMLKRPPHPRHGGPRNIIIERLDLDKSQVVRYDKLIQWHRSEIRKNEERIMQVKNSLYALAESGDTSTKDSLVDELASLQKQIEETHFKHFQDIRKLCRPDQLDEYAALMKDIASLFAPPRPGGPGR